jgi:DNA-binding CsgD family transcriptional regulator
MAVAESLAAGNSALQAGRWEDARAAFESALQQQETAEALLGLGEALWWLGETRPSVECHERAYAELRRAGEAHRAAWAAMWLCLSYKADLGNQAASSGWIARAERVLRDVDPGPLQGWLWLTRAYDTTDLALSRERAERAHEFARASGDLDLELCALSQLGNTLVAVGLIGEGLALVDEAMAGTLGGESCNLLTVVITSCHMLSACELAGDLQRATQWCRVVDEFIRKYGCPFLYASCRTLYGGILVGKGRWAEAERELIAAVQTTRGAFPGVHAQALARLADLRLRQGRLEEAEGLLSGVDDVLATAIPAAVIRLALGEAEVATALLQRRLKLLGESHLEAAPTLALLVEAHLARGDLDAAAATAERLSGLASGQDRDHVAARASMASARVSSARGETGIAIGQFETALERFSRLDLPLETARVRLELARALAIAHPTVAIAEARRALAVFAQLDAAADADAAAGLLRSLGSTGRIGPKRVGVLTQREQEVLRLVGSGLSNPEIARRLCISRKTAAHHVSSVLAKLDLRNRAEAVAYATRTLGAAHPRSS